MKGLLFLCSLVACGGAPAAAPSAVERAPAPAPLPETAFRDETPPVADRFGTRRIGPAENDAAPRFRGAHVDLDLRAADLHDVFRLLADVGKVDVVVGGEVSGTVTMRLRHVRWDEAMDVIARAKGLVCAREGRLVVVRGQP